MTLYDLRQASGLRYGGAVPYARHAIRMTPVDRPGQDVRQAVLDIDPPPSEWIRGRDFFGNRIDFVAIERPHERLRVTTAARVAVVNMPLPDPSGTPPFEAVAQAILAGSSLGPESPAHFVYPSRRVALSEAISDYAEASFPPGTPVLAGAMDLMARIHADFAYRPGATDVTTSPEAAFAVRSGVCQDFAHVMIAGLRGLGLAAAYASGCLRTVPPEGQPRRIGADATHAWVSVWCGAEAGWVGLDPTNDMAAGDDHVVLAIGRDYADVSPLDGIVVAAGQQVVEVSVDMRPLTRPE